MKARISSVLALSVVFLWGCGGGGSGLGANNAPPNITSFTATPLPNTAPCNITLTVVATDPDGTVAKYEWDYDYTGAFAADLDSGLVATATHNYTSGGQHICAVRVTDDKGKSSVRTLAFTLAGNQPPTVTLSCDPTSGPPTLNVIATATATDPDGTIVQYEWDWDYDGVTFNGTVAANPANHDYTVDGTYQVMVRVTDDGVPAATATSNVVTITVATAPANNPPVINSWSGSYTDSGTPTPSSGPIDGSNITVVNPVFPVTINPSISASDPDSDPLTYQWEVDTGYGWTGTTILSITNSLSYSNLTTPGVYYAKVTVSDGKGGSVLGRLTIILGGFIEAEFHVTAEAAGTVVPGPYVVSETRASGGPGNYIYVYKCLVGDTLYFHNDTALTTDIEWDFGDAATVADQSHPLHQYSTIGIYHVTFTISKSATAFTDIAHGIVAVGDSTHTVATHLVTWDPAGNGGAEPGPDPADGDYSATLTNDPHSTYSALPVNRTNHMASQNVYDTGDYYVACYHVNIASMGIANSVTVDSAVLAPYIGRHQIYGNNDTFRVFEMIGSWAPGDAVTWTDFPGGAPPAVPDTGYLVSMSTVLNDRLYWGAGGSLNDNHEKPPYHPMPFFITSLADGWIKGSKVNNGLAITFDDWGVGRPTVWGRVYMSNCGRGMTPFDGGGAQTLWMEPMFIVLYH